MYDKFIAISMTIVICNLAQGNDTGTQQKKSAAIFTEQSTRSSISPMKVILPAGIVGFLLSQALNKTFISRRFAYAGIIGGVAVMLAPETTKAFMGATGDVLGRSVYAVGGIMKQEINGFVNNLEKWAQKDTQSPSDQQDGKSSLEGPVSDAQAEPIADTNKA